MSEYYLELLEHTYFKQYISQKSIKEILKENENNNNNIIYNKKTVGKIHKIDKSLEKENDKIENDYDKLTMKAIEVVMQLYSFNEELKKHLIYSQVYEGKCYLINEEWFAKYKKFYLYEDNCKDLKKTHLFIYSHETIKKKIYDKYKTIFNNNYIKNNNEFSLLLKDSKYLELEYNISQDRHELIFLNQYSLINEKILENIISEDLNINEISISEYYINNKKLIIKYKENHIIIGEIAWVNNSNLLIPEIVLEYNNNHHLLQQFQKFKSFINDIKQELNLKGNEVEYIKVIGSKEILGKAYFIKKVEQKNNNNNDNYTKILLNIYLNYEYINYKKSKKFKNDQQFEICYIVNKNYINKLKEIFNYDVFCKYKIKEKFDIYKTKVNNFNELLNNNTFFEEIKNELLIANFFESLCIIDKKLVNEIKNDEILTKINTINLKDNNDLYYFKNFEIIYDDLYQILDKEHLTLNSDCMIKTRWLIGDNKIIFYPNFSCVNNLIVANNDINNDFISELILYYDNSLYLETHIKEILKNGYDNAFLYLSFQKAKVNIFKECSNEVIGFAYKITEYNSDLIISKEMEEEIKIIIKIYLFNLDLKRNIDISMKYAGEKDYHKFIYNDKCYLINKEWMSEYKKYYLYDDLYNYLRTKKIDIHHYNKKSYNETEINVQLIYDEIKNNADFFKKYYNKEPITIDKKLLELKEIDSGRKNKKNKEIKYYNDFVLINSELKKLIIVNKYKKTIAENDYVINTGKIIISLEYYPKYQILIGSLNSINNENNFVHLAFIQFEDPNELKSLYSKLMYTDHRSFIEKINKNNNKIYDKTKTREVGELFILTEDKDDDITKYLIELFFAFDNLNFCIKAPNKNISTKEKYYLINKELINYLNKSYSYEQIINLIISNEKNKDIIQNNRDLIDNPIDSQKIKEILNQIPEKIKNDINNKTKACDMTSFNTFVKNIKENDNSILYYDECILINERIKNILDNFSEMKDIFNININCFINLNEIFSLYKLNNNHLITIGKLDDNNILKNNIIITLDNSYIYNFYFDKIIVKNEIPNFVDNLKHAKERIKLLHFDDNKNCGFAFLLDNMNIDNNVSEINDRNINQNENKDKKNNVALMKEEIKVLVKYYIFNKKMIEDIELSKNNKNKGIYYTNSKYYLINSKFIEAIKEIFCMKEFISFLNYKYKNILPNNVDDSLINKMYEELLKNDIYKKFEKNFNNIPKIDENIIDLKYDTMNINNIIINYPNNFEIIDDNFYKDFIQKNNLNSRKRLNGTEIIFNDGKIIISENNSSTNQIILIGNIKNNHYLDTKFIPDILINSFDSSNTQILKAALKNMNYINAINQEKIAKNIFIHYFNESPRKKKLESNEIKNNNFINYPKFEDEEKKKNDSLLISGEKIIILFINLYLHYEELNGIINKEIKNSAEKYFLINKEFMRKYKEHYNYQEIKKILENDTKINQNIKNIIYFKKNNINYGQSLSDIIQMIKQNKEEFVLELGKKRENQNNLIQNLSGDKHLKIIEYQTESKKKLSYYEENEILNNECVKFFCQNESQVIISLVNKLEINCLLGENKIFINLHDTKTNYYYLDIGHLNNNIFSTDLIIYYYKNWEFNNFIATIKKETFDKYLIPHIKDIREKNISIITNNKGEIDGKIINIKNNPNLYSNLNVVQKEIKNLEQNGNAKKYLKLILYYNQFINRIKNSIKENEINSGYLVKYDFIVEASKTNIYIKILNYINNNQNIQKIINDNQEQDYNIIFNNIVALLNEETLKYFNNFGNDNKLFAHFYDANIAQLQLNTNNFASIANHFIIINDEINKLFAHNSNYSCKEKYYYFYRQNKIFILLDKYNKKNSLLMYYMNNKNELELEQILNFYNPNCREDCIKQIKELGYEQYQNYLLFSEGDLVSPIFDQNQNQIGNAYKYVSTINNYTNYNISFEIRKLFLLYLNYKKLKRNNNIFKEYYIVNKNWIQKYKNHYNFDEISIAIDKNNNIQIILNNILNNAQNTNFNFNDKFVALMMKHLPKDLIDDFNNRDKNFYSFKNSETKSASMAPINYKSNIFYLYDFELISSEIYEYLFSSMNFNFSIRDNKSIAFNESLENKAEKVECIIDNDYIIIQMLTPNSEGKYMMEIGKFDSKNIFEPEYILLYDKYIYLCDHVKNILTTGGFKEYIETFNALNLNESVLTGENNIKYGLLIRKNIIQNNNINNINNNPLQNKNLIDFQNKNTFFIRNDNNNNNNFFGPGNNNNNNQIIPKDDDNKNDDRIIPKQNKLNAIFPWPPRVGLDNIGATCYMNATLQCLCQIEDFALYFKYNNHINDVMEKYTRENKDCLTTSFKNLIERIWPDEAMQNESTKRHFPPHEFRQKIADMSPLFVNNQANDAKDLVNFIIMTLHEELNESLVGNNMNQNTTLFNNNNQLLEIFKAFYEEYKRTFRSIISDLFYAIQQTETKCLNCSNSQYNFQAYFFLVFPLEEVKKHAIGRFTGNNMNANNNQNINMNNMNNNMNNMNMMNNNMNMMNNMNNMNMMNNNMINNNIFNMNFGNMNINMNMNFFNNNMINNGMNWGMNNSAGMNNMFMNNPNFMNQQMQAMQQFNSMNIPLFNNNNVNINSTKLNKLYNDNVDIMDCFEYNEKVEFFTGTNQIYCNKCNQMSNANYNTILTTAPKVLILLLNRGVGIQFKIKLEFTTELDITKYINQKNGNIKYKLLGVITHLGESGAGGHFIAHCLSPIDNEWYTYNDAMVNKIDDFQKQIIDLGMPYLLFYKLIE